MSHKRIALYSLFLIFISDILVRVNSFIGISNGNTELVAFLNLVSVGGLFILVKRLRWEEIIPKNAFFIYLIFMTWSLFSFARGVLNAKDYWDSKVLFLNYLFSILVPLVMVIGLNNNIFKVIHNFVLKKIFIIAFLIVPFSLASDFELYSRVVIGVGLFILFVPYVGIRWRILIMMVAFISVYMDVSYRINTLRIFAAFCFLSLYIFRGFVTKNFLNISAVILFSFPLVVLALGVSGQFNIFTDNPFDLSVKTGNVGELTDTNLATDTRTFLYQEVFYSMIQKDSSFIIGEGGGSAYKSYWFSDLELNYRGRYGSEVGFLNTLLYSGVLGVLFYAMMLYIAAYYAINQSSNYLCKMLGFYLAAHWLFFFIEDITKFDLNYYFIWLAIGLCLSKKFRSLNDLDLIRFFQNK